MDQLSLWKTTFKKIEIWKDMHCVKSVRIRSFFWFVFSHIRTEYGEILRIFLYSVQMRENTNQKNSVFRHISYSDGLEYIDP